jgi:hypothetical protein
MKILAGIIEFIGRILYRNKVAKKDVRDIPKDNYPMF